MIECSHKCLTNIYYSCAFMRKFSWKFSSSIYLGSGCLIRKLDIFLISSVFIFKPQPTRKHIPYQENIEIIC